VNNIESQKNEEILCFGGEDWCYRFSKAGWKVMFWLGAKIIHIHGGRQSIKKPL